MNCTDPDQLLENPVTFVTFNYDMSLENHLYEALKNYTFFAEGGQSDRFFEKSDEYPEGRFLHIYGQLYPFSTSREDGKKYTNSFELANEIDYAFDAAEHIRTIAPDKMGEVTTEIEAAKTAISKAEYIYFLGYGFDSRNNELIKVGRRKDKEKHNYMFYTNFRNHSIINKKIMDLFNIKKGGALCVESHTLLGESYSATNFDVGFKPKFQCNKSTKNVYDALAEDFEFPD